MVDVIKTKLAQWWFLLSTLAIAVLVYIVNRRGRELAEIHLAEQAGQLAEKLAAVKEQSQRSSYDYQKAADDYTRLRSLHGPLLDKLGIAYTGGVAAKPDKPDSSGNNGPN